MRAFMSRMGGTHVETARSWNLAMREARAILAAVKPSADPWPETLGAEWDVSTPVWNLAPWEKRGACYRDLAADLEAFVNS